MYGDIQTCEARYIHVLTSGLKTEQSKLFSGNKHMHLLFLFDCRSHTVKVKTKECINSNKQTRCKLQRDSPIA